MKKEKNLPTYEILINESELDNSGIRFISLVDDPAIGVKGQYFKNNKETTCSCKHHEEHESWSMYFANYDEGKLPPADVRNFNLWDANEAYDAYTHPNCNCYIDENGDWITVKEGEYPCDICLKKQKLWNARKKSMAVISSLKGRRGRGTRGQRFDNVDMEFSAQSDKQVIVGPALIPNKKIYRKDEDGEYYVVFTEDVIRKMVSKFNRSNNNRSINIDHSNQIVNGFVQQNWIVEDNYYDKSKMYGFNLPVGTWFVEIKIDDKQFWDEKVKGDGKYSFSIEGLLGQRLVKMEKDMSIDEIVDSLTEDEVKEVLNMLSTQIKEEEFVMEPKSGESEQEFISRCIPYEINNGYEQSQAAAICFNKWSNR